MTRYDAKKPLDSLKRSSYPVVKMSNDNNDDDDNKDGDTHQGANTRSTTQTARKYDNGTAQCDFVESCAVFHMKDN